MKSFNKILCPYDFSKSSELALEYAIRLSDTKTEILLLSIIQLPYLIDPYGYSYYDNKAEELKTKTTKELAKVIEKLKIKYPNAKIKSKIETEVDPADKILETQKKGKHELIIMGSHGRTGLNRLLMGSVAESVMREANCPVLILKGKTKK